ncbi:hypothetical protein SS50377_20704 [Spironucleus salmonicida]|uniref:Uncharacterized protein n=1 Tax=Spironucleus salmonicida TaxID=348837 RepID=V6LY95_9EUKA|nr:hypothetical protein SS50377_20704 [Spironucleus salmonicida]|eukprot:EST49550.1 Hypothetical protein SS50377_10160 [Spironucleus salmonicida]
MGTCAQSSRLEDFENALSGKVAVPAIELVLAQRVAQQGAAETPELSEQARGGTRTRQCSNLMDLDLSAFLEALGEVELGQ